ncbi:hypothetical protein AGMMS49944_03660 [Spirochaetia bacterium]|nr:hypothetical protein AGMMS49944_03660 [Spirochaetia bacterium]
MSGFHKAVKSQAKARIAMFGPSGSGKTYTSLSVATGLGDRIALMDSENRTAIKYADRFNFDVCELETKTVQEYVKNIKEAGEAGYDVLIIDSLTHAWQILNEEVQKIADTSFQGNFWAAWSKGTPMQRELVDAILNYPGHIIATMRSKTEWQTGAKKPTRVGLAPEQGKGIEYEFDILFEINTGHLASIIKDRTGKFQDKIIDRPDRKFGKDIADWLSEGAPVVVTVDEKVNKLKLEITRIIKSKDEADIPYFSPNEVTANHDALVSLIPKTPVERLEALTVMLDEVKEKLQIRVSDPTVPREVPKVQPSDNPEADHIYRELSGELDGKTPVDRVKEVFHGTEVPQNGTRPVEGPKTAPTQNHTNTPPATQSEQSSAQIPAIYDTPEEPGDTDSYESPEDDETPPTPPRSGKKPIPKLGEIPGVHRGVAPAAVPPEGPELPMDGMDSSGVPLDIF